MPSRRTQPVTIRNARPADLDTVIALDKETTGVEKRRYWRDVFERFIDGERDHRFFLIAEQGGATAGFIVGEVRAWEFGSPPCGWVFALNVRRSLREQGVATVLFHRICALMKRAGVGTVRTMVERTNKVNLSFFRSMGLRTGPYVELEQLL
jgi:ribosomal protein S18 acetylase RimI-like enzyme